VRDIPLYSTCEHHLASFHGVAHVGYIPGSTGRITGLSKIARVVDLYAKRPQVQERLTSQIADAVMRKLDPRGAIFAIEAEHLCMAMRGIRKPGASTTTSAVRGLLQSSATARSEALDPILHKRRSRYCDVGRTFARYTNHERKKHPEALEQRRLDRLAQSCSNESKSRSSVLLCSPTAMRSWCAGDGSGRVDVRIILSFCLEQISDCLRGGHHALSPSSPAAHYSGPPATTTESSTLFTRPSRRSPGA